jgi:GT2 family glycosyltransferase
LCVVSGPAIPPLSVVMPVNEGRYLEESVGSIVRQTFADFELVIVTDALDDRSVAFLKDRAAQDPRIRVHVRPGPAGDIVSSNEAVAHSRAPLIARMDADDFAHPDRLRRQVEVFRERSGAVLVGTLCDGIDSNGRRTRPRDRARLRHPDAFVPFPHASAMFRRATFERVGGYRQACAGWPELDLFLRMAAHGRVYVLPDVLVSYRYHSDSVSTRFARGALERAVAQQRRCVATYRAGLPYDQLLESTPVSAPDCRAGAYVRQAAHRLWSGQRPPVRPQGTGLDPRALLYGLWGAASPGTLRLVLRSWIRLRDRLAARHIGSGPYEWHFASSS